MSKQEIIEYLKTYKEENFSIDKFHDYVIQAKNDKTIEAILIKFFSKISVKKVKSALIEKILGYGNSFSLESAEYLFPTIIKIKPNETKLKIFINPNYFYEEKSKEILKYLFVNEIVEVTNFYNLIFNIRDIEEFTGYIKISKIVVDHKTILNDTGLLESLSKDEDKIKYFLQDENFTKIIVQDLTSQYSNFVEKMFCYNFSPILLEKYQNCIRTTKLVQLAGNCRFHKYLHYDSDLKYFDEDGNVECKTDFGIRKTFQKKRFCLILQELKRRKFNVNKFVGKSRYYMCNRYYYDQSSTLLFEFACYNRVDKLKAFLEFFGDEIKIDK